MQQTVYERLTLDERSITYQLFTNIHNRLHGDILKQKI